MANIRKGQWKTNFDLELAKAHLILPKLRLNLESLTLLNCNVAPKECDRPPRARVEERTHLRKNYLPSQRSDLCKVCNCKIWPYESHSLMATGNMRFCLCLCLSKYLFFFLLFLSEINFSFALFFCFKCKWHFCSVVNEYRRTSACTHHYFVLCSEQLLTSRSHLHKQPRKILQQVITHRFLSPNPTSQAEGRVTTALVPSEEFTEHTINPEGLWCGSE